MTFPRSILNAPSCQKYSSGSCKSQPRHLFSTCFLRRNVAQNHLLQRYPHHRNKLIQGDFWYFALPASTHSDTNNLRSSLLNATSYHRKRCPASDVDRISSFPSHLSKELKAEEPSSAIHPRVVSQKVSQNTFEHLFSYHNSLRSRHVGSSFEPEIN